ncbi:MAG: DUF378 domain-containing protein [Peptostreptococcaceae bacterium]
MGIIYNVAVVLVLVGAVNWGLVSLFKFDLVAAVTAGGGQFGNVSSFSRIVYGLVGVAALYLLVQNIFFML